MAETLSTVLNLGITGTLKNTVGIINSAAPIQVPNAPNNLQWGSTYTGNGQINLLYSDAQTPAGAPVSYTFNAGSLVDPLGQTISAARLKLLLVLNLATTDGYDINIDTSVTHGITALTGGASGKITIPAGGGYLIWGPLATALACSSTTSVLKLDPGANTVSYQLLMFGNST